MLGAICRVAPVNSIHTRITTMTYAKFYAAIAALATGAALIVILAVQIATVTGVAS